MNFWTFVVDGGIEQVAEFESFEEYQANEQWHHMRSPLGFFHSLTIEQMRDILHQLVQNLDGD
jgi:hypothetical protein